MLAQPRQPAAPVRVRTARNATQRRISRKARSRHRHVAQFSVGFAAALLLLMAYVTLTAHLTTLNYAFSRALHERAALQGETARLDEQLATLRGDDRLGAIAARLHMQEPQQFALVTLPAQVRRSDTSHLAFLSGLATLFGAK
jgi:hypothetical protein